MLARLYQRQRIIQWEDSSKFKVIRCESNKPSKKNSELSLSSCSIRSPGICHMQEKLYACLKMSQCQCHLFWDCNHIFFPANEIPNIPVMGKRGMLDSPAWDCQNIKVIGFGRLIVYHHGHSHRSTCLRWH